MKKYEKPSKPCARKRHNMTRLDKPTAITKTGRRTRYVRDVTAQQTKGSNS